MFRTSQSKLSIKNYGYLKSIRLKFWQLKIYDKSIKCKNFAMKYTLNQVVGKKIGSKKYF